MDELDEDREDQRAVILRRRAQLAACAVVAGVGLPECTGMYCLEYALPSTGGSAALAGDAGAPISLGASAGENAGGGGQAFCLTIAGGEGGGPTPCLTPK